MFRDLRTAVRTTFRVRGFLLYRAVTNWPRVTFLDVRKGADHARDWDEILDARSDDLMDVRSYEDGRDREDVRR